VVQTWQKRVEEGSRTRRHPCSDEKGVESEIEPQSMPKGIDCGTNVAKGCRGRALRLGIDRVMTRKGWKQEI
jgi:hypothetical protein